MARRMLSAASSHRLAPYGAALLGVALFSVMDALMKRSSIELGAYSALLLRVLFGIVLTVPLWRASGGLWPDRGRLKLHFVRSAVSAGMGWSFFYALVKLPMAEAIALSFIAPLIALYLASVFLGERIRFTALLASLLGFAGVGVIALGRLGTSAWSGDAATGIAAVLFSAVLYAFNLILQRRQAQVASPQEVALFQNLCVALILGAAAPWLFVAPSQPALMDALGSAVLAVAALMCMTWAYARAETQMLVSSEYSAFVWACLMGWLWFGERLTLFTLAGVVLIVAACWIAARGAGDAK